MREVPTPVHEDLLHHEVEVLWMQGSHERSVTGWLDRAFTTNVVVTFPAGWTSVPYKAVREVVHLDDCRRCRRG